MGTVFAYMVMGELRQVVVCICISPDVGCFDVAYLFLEAMRQPDLRDKRGETYSHVFFVPNSLAVFEMANDDRQGSVGQHLCVPS